MLGKSYSTSPRHPAYFTPRRGRKNKKKFFKKPSFFNKIQDQDEKDPTTSEPSYLGQIYRNTKFKLSRSFKSKSSSSSQVKCLNLLIFLSNVHKIFVSLVCFVFWPNLCNISSLSASPIVLTLFNIKRYRYHTHKCWFLRNTFKSV
jgi:hypothetical protein